MSVLIILVTNADVWSVKQLSNAGSVSESIQYSKSAPSYVKTRFYPPSLSGMNVASYE